MSDSKHLRAVSRRARSITLPDGSSIELSAPTVRDWAQLEEEAVANAKRELISTWAKNADLLPEEIRSAKLIDAFERAEKITLETLPVKEAVGPAFGPDGKVVTADFKIGDLVPLNGGGTGKCVGKSGKVVYVSQQIPYVQWWLSATMSGQMKAVWLSARAKTPGLTEDALMERFVQLGDEAMKEALDEAANVVGDLSRSTLGNEAAPDQAGQATERAAL